MGPGLLISPHDKHLLGQFVGVGPVCGGFLVGGTRLAGRSAGFDQLRSLVAMIYPEILEWAPLTTARFFKHELEQELFVPLETIDLPLEGGANISQQIRDLGNFMEARYSCSSGFPLVPASCAAGSLAAALLALRAQVQSARALERRTSAAPGSMGQWWAWQLDATGQLEAQIQIETAMEPAAKMLSSGEDQHHLSMGVMAALFGEPLT